MTDGSRSLKDKGSVKSKASESDNHKQDEGIFIHRVQRAEGNG